MVVVKRSRSTSHGMIFARKPLKQLLLDEWRSQPEIEAIPRKSSICQEKDMYVGITDVVPETPDTSVEANSQRVDQVDLSCSDDISIQQLETQEVSSKLSEEDIQLEQLCGATCNTIKDRFFFACSAPGDKGKRLLICFLEQFQQFSSEEPIQRRLVRMLDVTKNNCSLMHICARYNNTACMEILHEYGMNVDCQDDLQATPLFYACAHNCQESAVFLLGHGSNPNHRDRYGSHPLVVCLRNNHLDLMKILCLYNADIDMKGSRGLTCLHWAAAEGHLKKVKYLLDDCKASLKRNNRDEEHILFSSLEHPHITRYICNLLDYKELTSLLSKTNSFGKTVFHAASEQEELLDSMKAIISVLQEKASDVTLVIDFLITRLNEKDSRLGYTPLITAVVSEREGSLKYLLSCSEVRVNEADNNGDTALHHAIYNKNSAICDILIYCGASVKIKNNKQESSWLLAQEAGLEINLKEINSMDKLLGKNWFGKKNKSKKALQV